MLTPKNVAELLTYSADAIAGFYLYDYQWIDNLHFLLSPSRVITDDRRRDALEAAVKHRFTDKCGWEGTGRLSLLWIPPFVFPLALRVPPEGIIVWHVKQHENGISCLLSPIPFPFEEFPQT